jgi:hypothetical protein
MVNTSLCLLINAGEYQPICKLMLPRPRLSKQAFAKKMVKVKINKLRTDKHRFKKKYFACKRHYQFDKMTENLNSTRVYASKGGEGDNSIKFNPSHTTES